ncbi:hypothetical protein EW146_g3028 [Bondarzewia mesenterica]|uniref:Uncharacterized protein n=1 Tax=Bondarzewia mesenterica TaxID=1095465 RepID=A0A4V3XFK2_9AGAM|nr:hypothetical protein EW146_g3028 [Bondarzewia mesenterica]
MLSCSAPLKTFPKYSKCFLVRPITTAILVRTRSQRHPGLVLSSGYVRHSHSGHDNNPEILEREKWRNLSKEPYQTSAPVDNAPGWNELLATNSEVFVKVRTFSRFFLPQRSTPAGSQADRAPDSSTKNLAERTVDHIRAKYSAEERLERTDAFA